MQYTSLTKRSRRERYNILMFNSLKKIVMNKEIFIESYEAPRVEIVEVEVEKGFAVSSGGENGNWN